ncbi:hypothetical protein [Paraconexibacter sp. AEG42_29]|uniref:hypothetical protein n=1 Tax=Paraconexibacter sp. AEG42_29 TaxID=2997339 RepID=UPI00339D4A4D
MSIGDTIQRRVMPRTIVGLSTVRAPGRVAASVRRARGGRATVRLFVAFDDPYSAVALLGLRERLARRPADLVVEAVVKRGIKDDPAVAAKRAHAVTDARRLALRDQRMLVRQAPLVARDVAFLATWTAALPQAGGRRVAFAAAALEHLWFASGGAVTPGPFRALWHEHAGGAEPPAAHPGVAAAEATMRRRGLYDTPIATVHGQWFFAHERQAQIEHRLDELGWGAAA